jgi:hypothetical protein
MSWTPHFWIKKGHFERVKGQFDLVEWYHNYSAHNFNILDNEGIVLSSECTSSSRDIHAIIKEEKHWLLNGEDSHCSNCVEWGDQVPLSDGDNSELI